MVYSEEVLVEGKNWSLLQVSSEPTAGRKMY